MRFTNLRVVTNPKTHFMGKKTIFLFFFLTGTFLLNAQEISIATRDSIHSNILDEDRSIWVSLPQGYNEKENYPVLYLLDGTTNLYATFAVTRQLANEYIPPMIIVAINNKSYQDRQRNMKLYEVIPDKDSPMYKMQMARPKVEARGKQFMSFIIDELIPYIDNKYGTAPYRIISGHSATGAFALDASIVLHPETFQACIAADPSVRGSIIKELNKKSDFNRNSIYIGIANMEDLTEAELDQKDINEHIGIYHTKSIFNLVDKINTSNFPGLSFDSKYYMQESHFSVPLITTFDGLRFIFNKYPDQVRERQKLFNSENPAAAIDTMEVRYEKLSEEYGFKLVKKESDLNELGYGFLSRKQMEAAKKCFELNIRYHPYSQNVYDSYGDYFLAVGNKEKAIEQFEKALEIEERSGTRKKLEKLINGG